VGAPHSPRSHPSKGSAVALLDAFSLLQNPPSLSHKANACEINQLSTLTINGFAKLLALVALVGNPLCLGQEEHTMCETEVKLEISV
jgi:hypothetical protein